MDAGHKSALVKSPTGTGKTVFFVHVIDQFVPRDKRALIIAHREELVDQAAAKVEAITGEKADIEMADRRADSHFYHRAKVVVASVQTLITGRMERFNPDDFALVIVDECHHAIAPSYRKVLDHFNKSFILGVTATPDRTDEKAMAQVFETVAFDYDLPDAVHDGWLVEPIENFVPILGLDWSKCGTTAGDFNQRDLAAAMANEGILQGIADATIREANGRRTLVFAPPGFKLDEATGEKFHVAEKLTEIFNRHNPDIAQRIHQDTPKDDRRRILKDFAAGKFTILVNIGVLTEGFDDPGIEVIAMARPTKSRALYAQCVGRGTRPLPGIVDQFNAPTERRAAIAVSGKPFCEVLDFQGNAGKHSIVCLADILGGDMDPIVAKKVKKKTEDGEKSVLKAIQEAEEESEAEQKADEERRSKLVARAIYEKRRVDSITGRGAGDQQTRTQGEPCTPKQAWRLRQWGIDPAGLTKRQASAIISRKFAEQEAAAPRRVPARKGVKTAPTSADLKRFREQAVVA